MNNSFFDNPPGKPNTQTGVVLLSCLIFLMALTLLGLSASADAILQNKLAANLQDNERAKQSALAALSWAENWLLGLAGPAPQICTEPCEGLYVHSLESLPPQPEFKSYSWWQAQGHEAGLDPQTGGRITTITSGSFNPPVWIIELLHELPPVENGTPDLQAWYRILVRGSGHADAAVSVIESTVVRSWPSTDSIDGAGNCPAAGPTGQCGRVSWRELR